ncbi:MAG: hypothetical protein ACYS0G_06050 [Planctomycetota bacterium]|jgi:hypothetical protein
MTRRGAWTIVARADRRLCGGVLPLVLVEVAGLAAWSTAAHAANECETNPPAMVEVIVDMDRHTPGRQSNIHVAAGTAIVDGVAIYILDPTEQGCVWGIGYLGGINRGIAFGHMPADAGNQGTVVDMTAGVGSPVNPGNVAWISEPPGLDPGFVGPEVQYVEGGAEKPTVIPSAPTDPILTVDIILEGAAAGDVFDFFLLDFVIVWSQGVAGAFSTQGPLTLDSGGDAVPDETQTIHGVDPDAPIPVPPAAYLVDFIDGPRGGGPATITIVPLGDLDGDGVVGIVDLLMLLGTWGPCGACDHCPADLDGDCAVGITDLLLLLANWG